MKTKYYGFLCILHRETPNAVCVSFEHDEHGKMVEVWVPKSVLHPDSVETLENGVEDDEIELYVAAWWLRKNF
jgi:hypothetical protein